MKSEYLFRTISSLVCSDAQIIKSVFSSPSMSWAFPIEFLGRDLKRYVYLDATAIDLDLINRQIIEYIDPYAPSGIVLGFYSPHTQVSFEFSLKLEDKPNLFAMLMIKLPKASVLDGQISYSSLREMLISLIPILEVQRSQIFDSNSSRYDRGWIRISETKNTNCFIGWMAYFSQSITEYMGRGRFEQLQSYHEKSEVDNGYLLILQEEPMDWDNPLHKAHEEKAIQEMGLTDLLVKR